MSGNARGRSRFALALAAAALSLTVPQAAGQDRTNESGARFAAGVRAATSGDTVLARREFLAAVAAEPAQPDAWGELLRLDAEDPERRALWVLDTALACADAQGRFTPSSKWPKVPREEINLAQKVVGLRATALKDVVAAAGKLSGSASTAALVRLERIAYDLDFGAGGTARDAAFAAARLKVAASSDIVVKALLQGAQTKLGKEPGLALRLARTARGILQQRGQTKATPAPPDEMMRTAVSLIEKARERFRKDETPAQEGVAPLRRVWTLDELTEIPDESIPAWNEAHASWDSPAVATTPESRYRVETPCGIETLKAALRLADRQHARVAAWCGKDPFAGKPGLIRVCPSDADFEAEGRPFWWAGGFQAGDVTTLVARFADGPSLGATMVHELTHRFDRTLWSGLPVWSVEGRATYVESCAEETLGDSLDDRFFEHGRLWEAWSKGYTKKEDLTKLLRCDVPDYRHYYDAGYALWLFLERFSGFDAEQKGKPIFKPRIRGWLDAHTGGPPKGDPVERFLAAFADGKEGRPSGMDAFMELFAKFVGEGGSGSRPPAPWRATWDVLQQHAWMDLENRPGRWDGPRIFDGPVWSVVRSRSDPPPAGEDLALEAAELLLLAGQKAPGLEAAHWALQADEPRAAVFARVAEIDEANGDASGAWFARAEAARLDPSLAGPDGAAVPAAFAAPWRSVRTILDTLAAESAAAETAGRTLLAFALRADHDRLAEAILAPPLGLPTKLPPGPPREPEVAVARSLLSASLREVRWARLDTQPGGAWHQVGADTVELGRSKDAESATSGAVRDASAKRVCVESPVRVSGTFTFKTRVRLVSAYTDAALVVGRTSSDRGLAIRIGGGDYDYAIGNRQGKFEMDGIALRLDDARGWDDRTIPAQTWIPFKPPREVFDLEVRVAGPFARVVVNGEPVLSFRRTTGAPIEGHVAFALERGIIRFEEPVVRNERALGPDRQTAAEPADERLRFDRPSAFAWRTAPGRLVDGLPRSPRGTLVLWYPPESDVAEYGRELARATIGNIAAFATGSGAAKPDIVIALPEAAAKGDAEWMVSDPSSLGLDNVSVRTHSGAPGLEAALTAWRASPDFGDASWPQTPVWIAVDPAGSIRRAGPDTPPWAAAALFRALAGR